MKWSSLVAVHQRIQKEIESMAVEDSYFAVASQRLRSEGVQNVIDHHLKSLSAKEKDRLHQEFFGFGPLETLMMDPQVTEILVNSAHEIWFECSGQLHRHGDSFFSVLSYRNCLQRFLESSGQVLSLEKPFCDFKFKNFRVSLVDECITHQQSVLSLRRHPEERWSLSRLQGLGWCDSVGSKILTEWVNEKKNFLVIGSTGSGKTTVINALMGIVKENERCLVIEDTEEISLPNSVSLRFLTREAMGSGLQDIDQSQLVKRTLRQRPDRLILGEIRGSEAKDFLMSLSTGHRGSVGTLHANDPHQALIRLEMLIQMGAPHWSLQAVRRLIHLSLDGIIHTERDSTGSRCLAGIYKISSLEDTGFLIEPLMGLEKVSGVSLAL